MRTEQFKLDIQRYTELMIRGGYQRSFAQAMYSIYIFISPSLARWFMSYVGETFGEKEKMKNIEKL